MKKWGLLSNTLINNNIIVFINMNKAILFFSFAVLFFSCKKESAVIREQMTPMLTYPFSDPDPVPIPEKIYYPYFRYDGFSKEADSIKWKVVVMENSYVKVHIFPEIGGKIWGAIEKNTGNEFIYYNSVVKFRDIAMRGPWTSGGIEFNFGIIGHTPAVSTPVDYFIKSNENGSVSCFIGVTDLLTRTRWEIEINLQPDKAYFTTNTKWYNSTPLIQPYYQWSNAAYQSEGNLEFIYPGNYWIGHDGEGYAWPIDETGRNLAFYENNNFGGSKSYHIVGGTDDFFAAYWHDLNFGAGHFSTYGDKLGKKIWIWSLSRSGAIWEDLLTDSDGQYVELQSGRLFNQASTRSTQTPFKHFGFSPYGSDTFKEYWYPIMNIGGAVKANSMGVLNVIKEQGQQRLLFSPLQLIKDEVKIYFGDELKYSFKPKLKPLIIWEKAIELNSSDNPLKIVIGKNKDFIYTEEEETFQSGRPLVSPESFDWNSQYGLFVDGVNWIYQNKFDRALISLKACLEKDRYFTPAINYLAELYYRKNNLKDALELTKKSLSINAYDPHANYLFGLINKQLNSLIDSQDGFAVASLSTSYRNASFLELAKLYLLKEELSTAKQYLQKVLKNDPENQDGILMMAIISRKNGEIKEAEKLANTLENLHPLNHFSRFEKFLLNKNDQAKKGFISMIKNELPHETFIEMACWYDYVGFREDAINLLYLSPDNALVSLQLAYLLNLNGSPDSEKHLENALQQSPEFILPFRIEFIPILNWAINKTNDWKFKYYLGLLHWKLGNKEKARRLFSECGQIPDSPSFYLSKVALFKDEKAFNAEDDLLRALSINKNNWRAYLAIIDFYLSSGKTPQALQYAEESTNLFPASDVLRYNYAKCLLANGKYSESLNILENTVILPFEGASYGRTTYRQAAIMEGLSFCRNADYNQALASVQKARLWPENLGVGKPYSVDERIEDYLEALCYKHLNQNDKSETLINKIIEYSSKNVRRSSADYLYLSVLKNKGRMTEIHDFLKKWHQNKPGDPVLRWSQAMINNNIVAAKSIEQDIDTQTGGTPWDPRYADSEFELIKAIASSLTIRQ